MRSTVRGLLLLIALAGHAHAIEKPSASKSVRDLAPRSQPPYAGYWAADRPACRNPDSDERMAIEAHAIQWYETRCTIGKVTPEGRRSWLLDLQCRGEGQRMAAHARVSLPTANTLVMDDGPIGPARRQHYLRCEPR